MSIPTYPDWQEPAEQSKQRKAVSRSFNMLLYSKTRATTEVRRVEIVKPLHEDPYLIYAGTGIKVEGEKVSAAMCDRIKHWKRY